MAGTNRLAVKAVLVKLAGRQVGSRHNHRAIGQQRLEQAAHNHRVGNVADLHFIEAENLRLLCNVHGDLGKHVSFAERLAALVNVLHEGVEVDALLRLHLKVCEKQIHQHGFAAAHVAKNINSLGCAVPVQQASNSTALLASLKRLGQVIETGNDCGLCGIGAKFAAGCFFGIGLNQRGHRKAPRKKASITL